MPHERGLSPEQLQSLARAARQRPAVDPVHRSHAANSAPVRSMPAWVARFHVLPGAAGEHWILCEPKPEPGDTFPAQFVLDVPPGRYMIELFDAGTLACIARESAEGAPLVAGLPYSGHEVLARVRRTAA